jgi:peptide/nickel transport system substrate-binding protein
MPDSRSTTPAPATSGRARGRRVLSRRVAVAAVLALALPAALAACRTADAANKADTPRRGGTLTLYLTRSGISHLDPQQIGDATSGNISRLITRTLTTYRSAPGAQGSEIVADLATDTGRPTQGNKVWEFTLKPKVRWEDGQPITCDQVKYGVERSYSSLLTDGLKYTKQYLQDNDPPYEGPFRDQEGLKSVQCVDERTIRFTLKQPSGDFGYVVSTTTFAPVRKDKDGEGHREPDLHPWANGPYKLKDGEKMPADPNDFKSLTLVRNPYWQQDSDSVRHQYPDEIDVKLSENPGQTAFDLIESQGENANAIGLDGDVPLNFVQQVLNDPELSRRAVAGSFGGVRYFAINTKRVTETKCRQGLVLAFNKASYLKAMGGSSFGDIATTMIPPAISGHKDFDVYGSKENPLGDPQKAQQLLSGCNLDVLDVAYPDSGAIKPYVSTLKLAYARAGVQVILHPLPPAEYWGSGIGNKDNKFDMMYAGWIPDFPNGSAVIPPLFDSRLIPKENSGNQNYSNLTDPAVDQEIDQAMQEADLTRQAAAWGALDEELANKAVVIPVLYMKALRMQGTKVRGAFIHPAFGQPDTAALGLAP